MARIDHRSGKPHRGWFELGDFYGEPMFVPRSANAAEGDGFLLSVIYRGASCHSNQAVLDAGRVQNGPLALAHPSHRVLEGFHGN